MSIKYLTTPTSLQIDKINVPTIVREQCPKCNGIVEIDLMKDFLINPIVNQPFDLHFTHEPADPCRYEWDVKMILRLGLVQASPAVFNGWIDPKHKVEVIKALRVKTGCGLMDGKKWVESKPHGINKELAEVLEAAGAIIEWRY